MDLKLTQREHRFLRWIVKVQYLSASQIAEFFFRSVTTKSARMWAVRRNLAKLEQRGIVGSFEAPPSGKRGRPEKVYYVQKRVRDGLLPILGLNDWEGYTMSVPRSGMFIPHHLAINDFLLKWGEACQRRGQEFDFLAEFHMVRPGKSPENYITLNCRHPYNPNLKRLHITPDWVNTLANPRTKKCSLFIGEMDRGTEPLKSSRPAESRTDVLTKLLAYREFLNEGAFGRFSEDFGFEFRKGFRLLLVTTTRLESIVELCHEAKTGDMVWVARQKEVTAENILGPIWTVPGLRGKRSLLKKKGRRRK